MTTQSRITQLIKEATTKDFDAETWRKRLDEWIELQQDITYPEPTDALKRAYERYLRCV